MTRAYLAFTEKGTALAQWLADKLSGTVSRCGRDGIPLNEWTAQQFAQADALILWELPELLSVPSHRIARARPAIRR